MEHSTDFVATELLRELKLENEQLRIMNKNLIETKFKGKAYGRKEL